MKKIAIKKLLVAVAIATATNISFAQTPYDSFAPSSEKKEMLKLPEVRFRAFRAFTTDSTNAVKYIESLASESKNLKSHQNPIFLNSTKNFQTWDSSGVTKITNDQ